MKFTFFQRLIEAPRKYYSHSKSIKMRYLSILFILQLSINYTFAQDAVIIKKGDIVDISFNSNLDTKDLEDIKEQLAALNITIEYISLEFNKKGKLKAIDFKVDCNDGFSGSASTKQMSKKHHAYFYRDYNENVKSPFGTGISRLNGKRS